MQFIHFHLFDSKGSIDAKYTISFARGSKLEDESIGILTNRLRLNLKGKHSSSDMNICYSTELDVEMNCDEIHISKIKGIGN